MTDYLAALCVYYFKRIVCASVDRQSNVLTLSPSKHNIQTQAIAAGIAQNPLVQQMLARQQRLQQLKKGDPSHVHHNTGAKPVYAGKRERVEIFEGVGAWVDKY